MAYNRTLKILANIMVAVITVLAWISGFIVMQIVYDSISASVIFGSVVAVIVFCESRFSYITLRSDGKVSISKEEVMSNLWQIVAATAVAVVVSVPLELQLFRCEVLTLSNGAEHDLGLQLHALWQLFSSSWPVMCLVVLVVVAIFNGPTIIRMISE